MTGALLAFAPLPGRPGIDPYAESQKLKAQPLPQAKANYEAIVRALEIWILSSSARKHDFEAAVRTAQSFNVTGMEEIQTLDDYLHFINSLLTWIPTEAVRPKELLFRITTMWFILDQPSVIQYQSPIRPTLRTVITCNHPESSKLTWLSTWMLRFSTQLGKFMDSPASAGAIDTFRSNPSYHMDEYIEPHSGWKTFNAFFARHVKPGSRPIASIGDSSVITSPADFSFKESHRVSADSTVTTKGVTWAIGAMLEGSPYKERFGGGVWLHGFLDVNDYHRVHAPVPGRVVEARVIQGGNCMAVNAKPTGSDGNGDGKTELTVPNELGYHISQTRGLVVIDTGFGLVGVLPVGMAVVSSVVLTAGVGVNLHKGEELGYFQFGGSDVVLAFEGALDFRHVMEEGTHYRMGREIGRVCGST
ncbi:phosphatidylserine decarboxylase [Aspergillus mulundensis]|uniref:Phosphatidylserine decarboxylase n=1 Tax=Aspergillus mulundensis TaxID=1810919 RepID=A0A3D8RZ49_9EURO|nr:Uncharacterized protein DSM5745_06175 [Aspergillus mulundensis]RDW79323.1 Uncharacterized protein DSM5745_06175 [Aspergillus mulundensis]